MFCFFYRFAFASWILMNILLCAVPRYGAYTMQLTGILMLFSNLLYTCMIPANGLRIPFEGAVLTFTYGRCFWMVFTAGITAIIIGATVSIVDILFPNKFSTILEVDYDTPYRYFVGNDAHIIGSLPSPMSAYYSYQSPDSLVGSEKYQKSRSSNGNVGSNKHISASKTGKYTMFSAPGIFPGTLMESFSFTYLFYSICRYRFDMLCRFWTSFFGQD